MVKKKSDERDPASQDFLANARIRALLENVPLMLDGADEVQILVFRRVLEIAMSQGRWAGQTGLVS